MPSGCIFGSFELTTPSCLTKKQRNKTSGFSSNKRIICPFQVELTVTSFFLEEDMVLSLKDISKRRKKQNRTKTCALFTIPFIRNKTL